ncbi:hypothetical protein [Veronia nyctiphanis]|uniref:hypothetical protein n=1 Tax=Veronia nyctiphanis TaxID=1278244 RepID=UPI001F2D8FA4|nr:hypothetical protein [Veronia nyctiphanis]
MLHVIEFLSGIGCWCDWRAIGADTGVAERGYLSGPKRPHSRRVLVFGRRVGLVIPVSFWAVLPFLSLGIFSFRAKTGKTRQVGPVPLLHLANGFGVLTLGMFVLEGDLLSNLILLLQAVILGAASSHCLLVKARSRLQAFNQILPIVGVVSVMLMSLAVAGVAYQLQLDVESITPFLMTLGLLLLGVAFWLVHLFKQDKPQLMMLVPALSAVTLSSYLLNSLIR